MHHPDLIVLDVLLPGLDGLEVWGAATQSDDCGIPIVMLTARSEDADVVAGLELGADDYLTKPLARVSCWHIKAVLRRQQGEADAETTVVYDDVIIHPGRYEVRTGDQMVYLDPDRVPHSALFGATPRVVFTRYQIVDAGGEDAEITERSVDVHVRRYAQTRRVSRSHRNATRGGLSFQILIASLAKV